MVVELKCVGGKMTDEEVETVCVDKFSSNWQ